VIFLYQIFFCRFPENVNAGGHPKDSHLQCYFLLPEIPLLQIYDPALILKQNPVDVTGR